VAFFAKSELVKSDTYALMVSSRALQINLVKIVDHVVLLYY